MVVLVTFEVLYLDAVMGRHDVRLSPDPLSESEHAAAPRIREDSVD